MRPYFTNLQKFFFGLMILALFLGACSQKPKVYRVGVLNSSVSFSDLFEGFKAKMTDLGYIEGENIEYDIQISNADPAVLKSMVEKFVADRVDLIYAFPTESAVAAKEATQGMDIPIIFAFAGIEGTPLVNNVREPGGNLTGVRFPGPEQIVKRLELMLEIAPAVKRVWIAYDKNYPNSAPALDALRLAADPLGVTLVEVPLVSVEDLLADLAARSTTDEPGIDALLLMPDVLNHSPEGLAAITNFAAEHKLPLGGSFLFTVEGGAIYGNANDLFKVGELAAPLADKVFKGTSVGTIPVVTPEEDLWINYTAILDLGLTVPDGLLRQAVKVIR